MRSAFVLLCVAASLMLGYAARAEGRAVPEVSLSGSDADAERTMHGAIGPLSHQLVTRWLRANPRRDLVLHLNSGGGKAVFGIKLYDAIEAQGRVATTVDAGQACLSACIYLWLAGRSRAVGDRAVLGFHSAFCTEACDLRGVGLINQSILDIVARTEPALAVLLSRTGAMISGNTVMALARWDGERWVMRVVRPPG